MIGASIIQFLGRPGAENLSKHNTDTWHQKKHGIGTQSILAGFMNLFHVR
jgi:hypothetical protein